MVKLQTPLSNGAEHKAQVSTGCVEIKISKKKYELRSVFFRQLRSAPPLYEVAPAVGTTCRLVVASSIGCSSAKKQYLVSLHTPCGKEQRAGRYIFFCRTQHYQGLLEPPGSAAGRDPRKLGGKRKALYGDNEDERHIFQNLSFFKLCKLLHRLGALSIDGRSSSHRPLATLIIEVPSRHLHMLPTDRAKRDCWIVAFLVLPGSPSYYPHSLFVQQLCLYAARQLPSVILFPCSDGLNVCTIPPRQVPLPFTLSVYCRYPSIIISSFGFPFADLYCPLPRAFSGDGDAQHTPVGMGCGQSSPAGGSTVRLEPDADHHCKLLLTFTRYVVVSRSSTASILGCFGVSAIFASDATPAVIRQRATYMDHFLLPLPPAPSFFFFKGNISERAAKGGGSSKSGGGGSKSSKAPVSETPLGKQGSGISVEKGNLGVVKRTSLQETVVEPTADAATTPSPEEAPNSTAGEGGGAAVGSSDGNDGGGAGGGEGEGGGSASSAITESEAPSAGSGAGSDGASAGDGGGDTATDGAGEAGEAGDGGGGGAEGSAEGSGAGDGGGGGGGGGGEPKKTTLVKRPGLTDSQELFYSQLDSKVEEAPSIGGPTPTKTAPPPSNLASGGGLSVVTA